jgi:N4-gp56 family major capsid protein
VGGFLTTAQYSQPTKIWNGEVGAIMGLRVLSSQNVLTATLATGISTLTAYTGFVLGESSFATVDLANDDAIDIIINKPGSAGAADPYRNIATVAYKMYFGVRYLSGSILADFNSANRALAVTMCVTFNG